MLQPASILDLEHAMRRLLPGGMALALASSRVPVDSGFEEERAAVQGAGEKRRQEFFIARNCARRALAELGLRPAAIPRGTMGAPVWPPGVAGSISHSDDYCAAVVTRTPAIISVGMDIEGSGPIPCAEAAVFCIPDEIARFHHLPLLSFTNWEKIAFCAKEACFKAYCPLMDKALHLKDIAVEFPQTLGSAGPFAVNLKSAASAPAATFAGRWGYAEGAVFAFAILRKPRTA